MFLFFVSYMELTLKFSVSALFFNGRNLTTFPISPMVIGLFDFVRESVLLIYIL